MVHTILDLWSKRFLIASVDKQACSAEDLLRAAAMQPFDLIICDHLFNADYSKSKRLSVESTQDAADQCCLFGGTTSPGIAQILRNTLIPNILPSRKAMDRFWGVEALTQLCRHPTTLHDTNADAALRSQDRGTTKSRSHLVAQTTEAVNCCPSWKLMLCSSECL
jgi:hypothetical protein